MVDLTSRPPDAAILTEGWLGRVSRGTSLRIDGRSGSHFWNWIIFMKHSVLKATLYSMLSFQGWWRQCTWSYLEAASTHCWRQRHIVTALATYAMTQITAWMPWWCNMNLLVPAGTSTQLNWIQCGFNTVQIQLTENTARKKIEVS
jgi:hypothetical protein